MLTEEEKERARQFERDYPEICADSRRHMEEFLNPILEEMKREREAFQRRIGLIK